MDADSLPTHFSTTHSNTRNIVASLLGGVVEYYDFTLYGYMAIFISTAFFASSNPTTALLDTFATFAVAFLLRVPGGILFGHLGDKYGRKAVLSWTILLMASATTALGLIPSYATLGIWATILVVLARCLQGLSAGGEISGATIFVAEHAPVNRRAYQTSMVHVGSYIAGLTAALVVFIFTTAFSQETMAAWAWRIPFLLSAIIGSIGVYIRVHLKETDEFVNLAESGTIAKVPFVDLWKTSWKQVLVVIGLGGPVTGGYYILTVYGATYLHVVGGYTTQIATLSTTLALIVGMLALPLGGWISDHIGRRPTILIFTLCIATFAIPSFQLLNAGNVYVAILSQCGIVALNSAVTGVSFTAFAELFSTKVRYTGIAFGNNTANLVMGGTAPYIGTWLVSRTGNSISPAWYLVAISLLAFVTALSILPETRGKELGD